MIQEIDTARCIMQFNGIAFRNFGHKIIIWCILLKNYTIFNLNSMLYNIFYTVPRLESANSVRKSPFQKPATPLVQVSYMFSSLTVNMIV